jgi:hypothetical protein
VTQPRRPDATRLGRDGVHAAVSGASEPVDLRLDQRLAGTYSPSGNSGLSTSWWMTVKNIYSPVRRAPPAVSCRSSSIDDGTSPFEANPHAAGARSAALVEYPRLRGRKVFRRGGGADFVDGNANVLIVDRRLDRHSASVPHQGGPIHIGPLAGQSALAGTSATVPPLAVKRPARYSAAREVGLCRPFRADGRTRTGDPFVTGSRPSSLRLALCRPPCPVIPHARRGLFRIAERRRLVLLRAARGARRL